MSPIYTHNVYHVPGIFCCWIFLFRCPRVGAYCIRPTKRPEGAILSIYRSPHLSLRDTYGAYAIRPYPTGRRYFYHACHQFFSGIHPFLVLIRGKGCEKKIKASGMPTKLAGYLIFSLFIFRFLLSRVGAYCIRPTNDPTGADSRRWEGPNFYRSAHIIWREGALPPNPYILFLP